MSKLITNAVESLTAGATDFPNSLSIQGTLAGTAATADTGTEPGDVPLNSDLAGLLKNQFQRNDTIRPRLMGPPEGFDWPGIAGVIVKSNPLQVTRSMSGEYTLDFPNWAPASDFGSGVSTPGETYYVSAASGLTPGSGTGTKADPYASIDSALANADASFIILSAGVYGKGREWTITPASTRVSISVDGGGRAFVGKIERGVAWETTGAEGVFKTEATYDGAAVLNAVAIDFTDEFGGFLGLLEFESASALVDDGGPGFVVGENGTVFVHRPDDSAPDSNNTYLLESGAAPRITGGARYNVRGLRFMGGSDGFVANTPLPFVYFKDCDFAFSDGDGANVDNFTGGIFFEDCAAYSNHNDGFNYHDNDTDSTFGVEHRCRAWNNGFNNPNKRIQNGSTNHDTGRVVRVNCMYGPSDGPVVVDISDSQSWNVGCTSYGARGDGTFELGIPASIEAWKGGVGYTGAKVWVEDCYTYGSLFDLYAHDGGQIFVRNTVTDGNFFEENPGDISEF